MELLSFVHHWNLWQAVGFYGVLFVLVTWAISMLCDQFEGAADYLGRNLPAGIKGATINAMGSSMPEFLSTFAFMFIIGSADAFGAGISITAGSAVFNSVFIPLCVIIAVLASIRLVVFTLRARKSEITIDKRVLIRDGSALIIAEIILILLLSKPVLTAWDGALLVGVYLPYIGFMWWQARGHENEHEEGEYDGWTFGHAWRVLALAVLGLVLACHFLAEAVIGTAVVFGVNAFITALFIGAAASSVPDTILSIKDALKGNEDDAISNAVGSNTFDICIALGANLLIYTLVFGPVAMPQHDGIQTLRIGLVAITLATLALFLIPRSIRLWHGAALGFLYAIWTFFALNTEFHWI